MTSKYYLNCNNENYASTYGIRGEAISSLLHFCKSLTVETKSKNDKTYVKVFKQ